MTEHRRWHASWLWGEGDAADHNVYRYFRRVVSVDQPAGCLLHLTATDRYRLYVNGEPVGEGPPPSSYDYQYVDSRDISAHLRPGPNCIAVVVHFAEPRPGERPGLLAELVDRRGATLAATDAQWRTRPADAWSPHGLASGMNLFDPYQEFHDARRVPEGWRDADFDDRNWDTPTVIGPAILTPPWSNLVPRDIPWMEERPVHARAIDRVEESLALMNRTRRNDLSILLSVPGRPLRYAAVTDPENLLDEAGTTSVQGSTEHLADRTFDGIYEPTILLDFGRVITGYVELDLDGVAGASVDIGFAERLIDGNFVNTLEGQFAARYIMTDGAQTWRNFSWRGFRYVKLRFRDCSTPITLRHARALLTRYPFQERGRFESTDDQLNAVWQICRHTTWLCCHESIMDTPWREQAQWLGDVAAVTLGSIDACFGDPMLPAKFLRQSAVMQHPTGLISNTTNVPPSPRWNRDIPDYSLWWIIGLDRHYQRTGDRELLGEVFGVGRDIIECFERHTGPTGLVGDMPYWVLFDWADIDRRGTTAPMNALLYEALAAMIRMAQALGHADEAARYQRRRAAIAAAFDEHFYDSDRGVYIDCHADGERSTHVSEHANFTPIWAGLCDPRRGESIATRLLVERSVIAAEAAPFYTSVVLWALERIGRFDLAMQVIRDRWGRRFVGRGLTSCLEEWTCNGSWRSGAFQPIQRTLSHAWSACPADFLIRNVIGLTHLEPGGGRIRLQPRDAGCDYRVTYPMPQGPLVVERTAGTVTINAPHGVTVEP